MGGTLLLMHSGRKHCLRGLLRECSQALRTLRVQTLASSQLRTGYKTHGQDKGGSHITCFIAVPFNFNSTKPKSIDVNDH